MRLLTWNVGHRTRRKALPAEYAVALAHTKADVIVLTEYVEDPTHGDFHAALTSNGYAHCRLSRRVAGENQVLIACRKPLVDGAIECCAISSSTKPNWLHMQVDGKVDVVGFRVPMFQVKRGRPSYWRWLAETLPQFADRPAVLIGDFNASATYRPVKQMVASGWQLATPRSGWSFKGRTGGMSAIDHALVSKHYRVAGASYEEVLNGLSLAGSKTSYSDHAALVLDVTQ